MKLDASPTLDRSRLPRRLLSFAIPHPINPVRDVVGGGGEYRELIARCGRRTNRAKGSARLCTVWGEQALTCIVPNKFGTRFYSAIIVGKPPWNTIDFNRLTGGSEKAPSESAPGKRQLSVEPWL
jgi:hypothetical protein